jgi:hypothetical protein
MGAKHDRKILEIKKEMEQNRGYACKKNYPIFFRDKITLIDLACFKEGKKPIAFEVESNTQPVLNAKKLEKFREIFNGKSCQRDAQPDNTKCLDLKG